MSIVTWIAKQVSKMAPKASERRRYERYAVTSGLEIIVNDKASPCRVDNVSAGGLRVTPAIDAPVGAVVSVRDPGTSMSLDGEVLGHEDGGTRLQFESEDAGIIVSAWLRVSGEGEERTR